LERVAEGIDPIKCALTKDIHVLPDFHGNRYANRIMLYYALCMTRSHGFSLIEKPICSVRSPLADPKAKGMISGLSLTPNEKDLALLYYAVIQSIAYGTRHIIEHCNKHGHKVWVIFST
jgi:ribulose kinase